MTWTDEADKNLLGITAAIIVIICIVQAFAVYVDLYSTISWFDNLMHFFGGVFLGYLIYTIYARYFPKRVQGSIVFLLKLLLMVFVVGLLWEIFEIIVNELFMKGGYDYVDIMTDLIFDVLGGILSMVLLWIFHLPRSNRGGEEELENNI